MNTQWLQNKIDTVKKTLHKVLNPRLYAKTTEDLPLWYKCLVPHDGSLPYKISKTTILGKEAEVKLFTYRGRRWMRTDFT